MPDSSRSTRQRAQPGGYLRYDGAVRQPPPWHGDVGPPSSHSTAPRPARHHCEPARTSSMGQTPKIDHSSNPPNHSYQRRQLASRKQPIRFPRRQPAVQCGLRNGRSLPLDSGPTTERAAEFHRWPSQRGSGPNRQQAHAWIASIEFLTNLRGTCPTLRLIMRHVKPDRRPPRQIASPCT